MEEIAVIPRSLYRVSDGVAEIQERSLAGLLALVCGYDAALDLDVSANQRRQIRAIEALKPLEHFRIANYRMFDQLREPLPEFAWR